MGSLVGSSSLVPGTCLGPGNHSFAFGAPSPAGKELQSPPGFKESRDLEYLSRSGFSFFFEFFHLFSIFEYGGGPESFWNRQK